MPDEIAPLPVKPRPTGWVVGFVLTWGVVGGGVLAAGWYTDLREVMHVALSSVAVFAFLPFVLIALGLALIVLAFLLPAIAVAAALFGAGGDGDPAGVAQAGTSILLRGAAATEPYYNWLARRRHPVFWGLPVGVLLGGIALWLIIYFVLLPGERRTVVILAETRVLIERVYDEAGRYPEVDRDTLTFEALRACDVDAAGSGPVLDGFGRPLAYAASGRWKFREYSLRSCGFDGVESVDDLCLGGQTGLQAIKDGGQGLRNFLRKVRGKEPIQPSDEIRAIRQMRACPRGTSLK